MVVEKSPDFMYPHRNPTITSTSLFPQLKDMYTSIIWMPWIRYHRNLIKWDNSWMAEPSISTAEETFSYMQRPSDSPRMRRNFLARWQGCVYFKYSSIPEMWVWFCCPFVPQLSFQSCTSPRILWSRIQETEKLNTGQPKPFSCP